jgi:hypothetical protein
MDRSYCEEPLCSARAMEECDGCGLHLCGEHVAEYEGDIVCWSCCDAMWSEDEGIND